MGKAFDGRKLFDAARNQFGELSNNRLPELSPSARGFFREFRFRF